MEMLDLLRGRLVRTRDSRRKQVAALVTIDSLEVRLLLTAPTMTDSEQYMLELINRARAIPSAEAARLGIGLNDGVPANRTISTAAKQPLAPQQQLITAAGLHSQDMLDRDYFDHTTLGAGTVFSQRVTNQGYNWTSVAENIGYAAKTVNASQTVYIDEIHNGLIRSSGHRENIMAPVSEELGIGARLGSFTVNSVTYNFTEMVTQDFGSRNLNPYITGLVYTDANNNSFYTIGESIRGGTVSAVNVSTGAVFSDTIGVSGAYGFVVPAGTYTVSATFTLNGATQNFQKPGNVAVGSDNVKVDFETNSGVLVPLAISLSSTATTLNENGATSATMMTVTRNGSPASSLTVNLASSDTSEVTVPATVVIPSGQLSVTFTASAVDDGIIDGNQSATITATASGFPSTNRTLSVTDRTYPTLPAGIQTVATARPTFTWTAISNAATYEVYVKNVTTNELTPAVNERGIAVTSYTTAVDLPIGTFNVWVRGFTAAGLASGWSPAAVWKLRPTTTVLNSGRTEPSGSFRINWNPIPGASTYDVSIYRLTPSRFEYLRERSVIGTTLSVSNFDVGSYGIWVRASNSAGDVVGWSPQATINVNYAPTGISVIAASLTSTPTLSWSFVGGAALYEVWIGFPTGGPPVIRNSSVQGTTLELNGLAPASYRAFVRGRDLPGGGYYLWSTGFDFEVGRAPRITSPTSNGQPARPTITWTSVSGATRYEIWLLNLTTDVREVSNANLLSTSYTPTTDLTSSNNYRVWIRAFDSSGAESAWSLPATFTIASNPMKSPNTDSLLSPVGDPVLELLFASADAWLHEQAEAVPPAAETDAPTPHAIDIDSFKDWRTNKCRLVVDAASIRTDAGSVGHDN